MITKEDLTNRVKLALLARNALRKSANKNVAVAMKVPALLTFQKSDNKLKADGLYGPNSFQAISYYIKGATDNTTPLVNPKFSKSVVTWTPPDLTPAKVETTTAPKPVTNSKPSTVPGASSYVASPTRTEVRSPTKTSTKATTKGNRTSTSTDGSYNTTNNYGQPLTKAVAKAVPVAKSALKAPVAPKAVAKVKVKPAAKVAKQIAKVVGKPPVYGQEKLTQEDDRIDAEQLLAIPNSSRQAPSMDMETNIARDLASTQNNGLKGIKKTLLRGSLSREATSEHNTLVKRDNFRRQVTEDLTNIKAELAARKTSKGGAGDNLRLVGLVL